MYIAHINKTEIDFAIIVPYRNRIAHLRLFVPHMKKRFKRSQIFLIEQADKKLFNRGALLNIGYLHFAQMFPYAAYHDVDMLPTKADYSYPVCPTHLATRVQQFRQQLPYENYFGGVVLFNRGDYHLCGGYSNHFWGWGGEDDELYNHITSIGMRIQRRVCFYDSLPHKRAYDGPFDPAKLLQAKLPRKEDDGYGFTKYEVKDVNNDFYGCTKLAVML